jgi:hypothetical protein
MLAIVKAREKHKLKRNAPSSLLRSTQKQTRKLQNWVSDSVFSEPETTSN